MNPDDDLPLFAWKAAPTTSGPRAPSSNAEPARRDYITEWASFVVARADIASWIEQAALGLQALGVRRIETDDLFKKARAAFGRGLNHNHRRACALWLISRTPSLADLIELRGEP
jgi:hypothetical protein